MESQTIYHRIILKVSGEALQNETDGSIYDEKKLKELAEVVKSAHEKGTQIGIVVGAGNIWRGRMAEKVGIERSTADYMGMLGTIMNALALQSVLESLGLDTRVLSAINVPEACEPYIRRKAVSHLDKGRVIIFAGGTGNPYFTTDTCATLRALEINADAIIMGKNGVEGVYDSDPRKNKNAKLLRHLTYQEVMNRKLAVMDLTAVAMLADSSVKIHVFNMSDPNGLTDILDGKAIGSVIAKE
ncbi:MAG: UMP kinase [Erysipelotrichaceae bacterium]|nr:UMP kinase [Erysipelotrichaceae bacterium]